MAEQLDNDGAITILEVIATWQAFKRGHDLDSMKMKCCETSKLFFSKMDELEMLVMKGDK